MRGSVPARVGLAPRVVDAYRAGRVSPLWSAPTAWNLRRIGEGDLGGARPRSGARGAVVSPGPISIVLALPA